MRASEALAILEGLDPNHEVTLTIGRVPKKVKPETYGPATTVWNPYTTQWVIEKEFWPKRNDITCKLH